MARFFKFSELIVTNTGLPNIPNWDGIEHLETLAAFLDNVRRIYGKPIRVNCAYRSKDVNEAVGGVATSAHLKGLAADICAWSGSEKDNRLLLKVLESQMSKIDQLIPYFSKAGNPDYTIRFIHVGLSEGVPRQQKLYK